MIQKENNANSSYSLLDNGHMYPLYNEMTQLNFTIIVFYIPSIKV